MYHSLLLTTLTFTLASATFGPGPWSNFTVDLAKNSSQASASGHGYLLPWGQIGLGCGINWRSNSSFGGGLQTGTDTYGLGGGWTVDADNTLSIGLGVGIGKGEKNTTADVSVKAHKDGVVEIVLETSGPIVCAPIADSTDGKHRVRCGANNLL